MIEIIWDVHGSLVDFARPAAALHGLRLPDELPGIVEVPWNLGLRSDEFWSRVEFRDAAWWANLKPIRSLASSYRLATVIRGVSTVQLVTSPGSPIDCRPAEAAGTTALCIQHFNATPWIIDVKAELYRPGRILIDDNESQIDAWRSKGGQAVTPPQPWNGCRCWPLRSAVSTFRSLLARAIQLELQRV